MSSQIERCVICVICNACAVQKGCRSLNRCRLARRCTNGADGKNGLITQMVQPILSDVCNNFVRG